MSFDACLHFAHTFSEVSGKQGVYLSRDENDSSHFVSTKTKDPQFKTKQVLKTIDACNGLFHQPNDISTVSFTDRRLLLGKLSNGLNCYYNRIEEVVKRKWWYPIVRFFGYVPCRLKDIRSRQESIENKIDNLAGYIYGYGFGLSGCKLGRYDADSLGEEQLKRLKPYVLQWLPNSDEFSGFKEKVDIKAFPENNQVAFILKGESNLKVVDDLLYRIGKIFEYKVIHRIIVPDYSRGPAVEKARVLGVEVKGDRMMIKHEKLSPYENFDSIMTKLAELYPDVTA